MGRRLWREGSEGWGFERGWGVCFVIPCCFDQLIGLVWRMIASFGLSWEVVCVGLYAHEWIC